MTGKELRQMRKHLEMTQADLARALGLQRNSITLMEAGERPVVKTTELAVRFLLVKFKKGEGR
jgi:DNA-binding XRE family transcriptional regulator